MFGPGLRIEGAGALRLCLPGASQAFGIDFDEAERRAGGLGAAVHRVVGSKGGGTVTRLAEASRVGRHDGARDVVLVVHGRHCEFA